MTYGFFGHSSSAGNPARRRGRPSSPPPARRPEIIRLTSIIRGAVVSPGFKLDSVGFQGRNTRQQAGWLTTVDIPLLPSSLLPHPSPAPTPNTLYPTPSIQ